MKRKPLTVTTATKYYCRRLWKITWRKTLDGKGRLVRLVKHYEKQAAIGRPWMLVRAIVMSKGVYA